MRRPQPQYGRAQRTELRDQVLDAESLLGPQSSMPLSRRWRVGLSVAVSERLLELFAGRLAMSQVDDDGVQDLGQVVTECLRIEMNLSR